MMVFINRIIVVISLHLCCVIANAQQFRLMGTVQDANTRQAISNVNIFFKDTQTGTISDLSGRFNLVVVERYEQKLVVFQHIGYEPLEIAVDSLRALHYVYLQPRVIPLQGLTTEAERIHVAEIEKDIPQPVTMLESKTFEIRGFIDAGDLLKTEHSIQVEEDLSGKKTVSIRGGNPDEIVVMYNGVKLNRAYDNTFDLSLIDLEDIDRFEIIKGSNTALYGPEAFSGVINIVPKTQYDYHVRFQQRLGTYQSGNWGLHLHNKFNRFHSSYSYKRGGMKRHFADLPEEEGLLENNSVHHTANLNYHISENPDGSPESSIGAMYVHSSLEYNNQRDIENVINLNELLSLRFQGHISRIRNIQLSVSSKRFDEDQILASGTGSIARHIKDRALFVNAEKGVSMGPLHILLAYQFQHVKFDFNDDRTNFSEQAVGLESAVFYRRHHGFVTIGKLRGDLDSEFLRSAELDVSLRHDRVIDEQENAVLRVDPWAFKNDGNNEGLFDRHDWKETMFKFAFNLLGYQKDFTMEAYLSFGMNTKFPTLFQQISSPSAYTAGGVVTSLNPEKNRSTELSLSIARDVRDEGIIFGWELAGNFFQNVYDNKFRVSTVPGIPIAFYDNVPDARISGFETKSSLFLLKKKVTLQLGVSKYFISEKAAFPFKSDYKHTFNFMIDHAGYALQIHLFKEGEQVGWIRQGNQQFAEISLPDYTNMDFHLSKTFSLFGLRLFMNASGRNLIKDDEDVILQGLAIRDRRYYVTFGVQY